MRNFPQVPLSPCPPSYARPVAQTIDYWQEALHVHLLPEFTQLLEASKTAAAALSDALDATVECNFNGHKFKAHATGAKGGVRYRLESDDVELLISTPKREWPISVRYLSAGLWEHGLKKLRSDVFEALAPYTRWRFSDCIRVTRVDYCFDFFSPPFAAEFRPSLAENVVIHSSTKSQLVAKLDLWSRGPHGETLTIGTKKGLQVQLYDKTLEITERSGKEWLYDVWKEALGFDPWGAQRPRNVYRLECRFTKEFLKQRNIRRPHEFMTKLPELVSEALYTRKLASPCPSDSHRHRWPLHPFWSEAIRQFKAEGMLPIGRKVVGRRDVLLRNTEKAIAGNLRSASVLQDGRYDKSNVIQLAERAFDLIETDPRHAQKVEMARSRYSDVDEAK